MLTSPAREVHQVSATGVHFTGDVLHVSLSDGREVSLPLDRVVWLRWLLAATPEQRARWSLEPGGFAVYWEDLDDGFEVSHLLALEPLA
jgi:hypothetical protein